MPKKAQKCQNSRFFPVFWAYFLPQIGQRPIFLPPHLRRCLCTIYIPESQIGTGLCHTHTNTKIQHSMSSLHKAYIHTNTSQKCHNMMHIHTRYAHTSHIQTSLLCHTHSATPRGACLWFTSVLCTC